jgi:oxygen-independent coproporphyrinogen-3 oxidase
MDISHSSNVIKITCPEELGYHAYHIVSLYHPYADIRMVDEDGDICISISSDRLRILFYGTEHLCGYDEKDDLRRALFTLLRERTGQELPWGILVGVRPSKVARKLLDGGMTFDQAAAEIRTRYLATDDKARLAAFVAQRETELISGLDTNDSVSIYLGMPFCPTRCAYCSFASYPYKGNKYAEDYLRLMKKEIGLVSGYLDRTGKKVTTVYFGGGTPTSVGDREFREIMECIGKDIISGRNVREFTVEAGRADSITPDKLRAMKEYGADRISINPQTMNDKTLRLIGRNHDSADVDRAFRMARSEGFDNINMDVIIGLPGEGIDEVRRTLDGISALSPESLTVHGLSMKRASRLYEEFVATGRFPVRSQAELNEMYGAAHMEAEKLGLLPYYMYRQKNIAGSHENVGFAKQGRENLYNILMIEEVESIIAIGADGISKKVGKGKIERFANFKDVREYVLRHDELMEKKIRFLET